MFIDILIALILTTVWLVTLMRPICQLQRFSDVISHFVNLKCLTNTEDKGVVLLETKDKTRSFFNENRQWVYGSLKHLFGFGGEFCSFLLRTPKKWSTMTAFYALFGIGYSLGFRAI